ncbi:uncharacterized protein [Rutidosis leptorrhynchoides]|uniref:uncharacterized protein n=1 Tax=Rutidosis leptorrhynchoides TaxID=125765 RepID=UPI003A993181
MGERLKTQDKLKLWDLRANPVLKCLVCNDSIDSHAHLFFKCGYSAQIWRRICSLVQIHMGSDDWKVCRDRLVPIAHRNYSAVVVAKLCYAASVYFIWQERNSRLFNGKRRSVEQMFELIRSNVRLKLMTVRFKTSSQANQVKADWLLG